MQTAAMAATQDLSSFVSKFVELWHPGREAKLSLSCYAGRISIQLGLETGHQAPAAPPQKPPRQPGPSRLGRRARRAEERARAAAEEAAAASHPTLPAEQAKKVNEAVQADVEPQATIDVVVETVTLPAQTDAAEQANVVETFPQQAAAVHAAQLPPPTGAKESKTRVFRKKEEETWAKLFL